MVTGEAGGGENVCTCIKDIEEKIKEQFNSTKKENETIESSSLIDTAIFFDEKYSGIKTFSVVEVNYEQNCKTGATKTKNKKYNMLHKYCPFCGQGYSN